MRLRQVCGIENVRARVRKVRRSMPQSNMVEVSGAEETEACGAGVQNGCVREAKIRCREGVFVECAAHNASAAAAKCNV